ERCACHFGKNCRDEQNPFHRVCSLNVSCDESKTCVLVPQTSFFAGAGCKCVVVVLAWSGRLRDNPNLYCPARRFPARYCAPVRYSAERVDSSQSRPLSLARR